jgi:hypothetical protein
MSSVVEVFSVKEHSAVRTSFDDLVVSQALTEPLTTYIPERPTLHLIFSLAHTINIVIGSYEVNSY